MENFKCKCGTYTFFKGKHHNITMCSDCKKVYNSQVEVNLDYYGSEFIVTKYRKCTICDCDLRSDTIGELCKRCKKREDELPNNVKFETPDVKSPKIKTPEIKFKTFEGVSDEIISEWINDKTIINMNTTVGQFLIHESYPEHGSQTILVHTFIYQENEEV